MTRNGFWGQTIANIPTIDVLWCYIVFNGMVQYRMNIVNFERNASKEFNDGGIIRVFNNKNWINLTGPVIKAPREIPWKGFQGFRYTEMLF
ncbi:MAG TPA: hypothetical protein VFJ43_06815 [Bacteroidia bacterium]|nr:hypothetical protein [Bacteroidia bacterium]